MDTTEIIFSLAIAILFTSFFYTLINKLTGYNDKSKMCDNIYSDLTNDEQYNNYKKCNDVRDKELEKIEFNRHVALLTVAIVGVICTSFIQTSSTKFGVGYGSIFILFIALASYWHQYGEVARIVIYGILLLFVAMLSIRLYNVGSISDIFATEYGTK